MANPNVQELRRPFDPMGADAEEQYDTVVRRLNRARARRAKSGRELAELERQFVEDDLYVRTGARAGQRLSRDGRRRRLRRLIELGAEAQRLEEEERFSLRALDQMNEELERWARETYGP